MEQAYTIQLNLGFILTFLVAYGSLASTVGVLLYRVRVLTNIIFNNHGELNFRTVAEVDKISNAVSETKELCSRIEGLADKMDSFNRKLNGIGDESIMTVGKHKDICNKEQLQNKLDLAVMFKSFESGLFMKLDDRDKKFIEAINSRDDKIEQLIKTHRQ